MGWGIGHLAPNTQKYVNLRTFRCDSICLQLPLSVSGWVGGWCRARKSVFSYGTPFFCQRGARNPRRWLRFGTFGSILRFFVSELRPFSRGEPGRRAQKSYPTPLWGHRLPVTALALSAGWIIYIVYIVYPPSHAFSLINCHALHFCWTANQRLYSHQMTLWLENMLCLRIYLLQKFTQKSNSVSEYRLWFYL